MSVGCACPKRCHARVLTRKKLCCGLPAFRVLADTCGGPGGGGGEAAEAAEDDDEEVEDRGGGREDAEGGRRRRMSFTRGSGWGARKSEVHCCRAERIHCPCAAVDCPIAVQRSSRCPPPLRVGWPSRVRIGHCGPPGRTNPPQRAGRLAPPRRFLAMRGYLPTPRTPATRLAGRGLAQSLPGHAANPCVARRAIGRGTRAHSGNGASAPLAFRQLRRAAAGPFGHLAPAPKGRSVTRGARRGGGARGGARGFLSGAQDATEGVSGRHRAASAAQRFGARKNTLDLFQKNWPLKNSAHEKII